MDRMASWERRWADADYDWVNGYRDDYEEGFDVEEVEHWIGYFVYNDGLFEEYANELGEEEYDKVTQEYDGSVSYLKKIYSLDEACDRIISMTGKESADYVNSRMAEIWESER